MSCWGSFGNSKGEAAGEEAVDMFGEPELETLEPKGCDLCTFSEVGSW